MIIYELFSGGKKKPLKAPKKAQNDLDEVINVF